jgi:biopolymer transport protein ExbB
MRLRMTAPIIQTLLALLLCLAWPSAVLAQEGALVSEEGLDVRALINAGGTIGFLIIGLSVAMVALIVEHLLSIRRRALMPPGLAEDLHKQIAAGQYTQAEKACREQPSFLSYVVASGLQDIGLGYTAVEKAMEDASQEQAARLYRKIEYLSVIGAIAPMLGLMGTVWGMILAFSEFAQKANPQVAEFAPGISRALVTTLLGLCVAVPALASFFLFRNRIDEMVAEISLKAEAVLSPYKRSTGGSQQKAEAPAASPTRRQSRPAVPPVVSEREGGS